jgi:hypothetical protein
MTIQEIMRAHAAAVRQAMDEHRAYLKQRNQNMKKTYMAVEIVRAEPENNDGRQGYRAYFPAGSMWVPRQEFEGRFRELTRRERQLCTMSELELQVMAASDGQEGEA